MLLLILFIACESPDKEEQANHKSASHASKSTSGQNSSNNSQNDEAKKKAEEETKKKAANTKCIQDCMLRKQMEARGADAIQRDCENICEKGAVDNPLENPK